MRNRPCEAFGLHAHDSMKPGDERAMRGQDPRALGCVAEAGASSTCSFNAGIKQS